MSFALSEGPDRRLALGLIVKVLGSIEASSPKSGVPRRKEQTSVWEEVWYHQGSTDPS
jgi:hypothetical protein